MVTSRQTTSRSADRGGWVRREPSSAAAGACGWYATDGFMQPRDKKSMNDIVDGTSQSLAFGERAYELRSWLKSSQLGLEGSTGSIVCTSNIKMVVHQISNDHRTTPGYYSQTRENPPPDALQGIIFNQLAFGSEHPAGSPFVYADAHVEFVGEDLDLVLYRNLASIDGGEMRSDTVEPQAGNDTGGSRNL